MKVIIDPDNLEILYWRDSKKQWWKRTGECKQCGVCCRFGVKCEYLEGNLCSLRKKGIRNLNCFLGPFPDTKYKEIKEKCSYKWVKTTLKECLK